MRKDVPSRRQVLRVGVSSAFGALVARYLWGGAARADEERPAKARACILLWLNGGPSHIDTFDPKPGRPGGGTFKSIATRAPGLALCEHLPQLAEQADALCVVRSMTSKEGNH